jgi:hypothetical protein
MKKLVLIGLIMTQILSAQNLVINGGFDTDLFHWSSSWQPLWIADDGSANSLNGCMQSQFLDGTGNGGSIHVSDLDWIVVEPNAQYGAESFFKLTQASQVGAIKLEFFWFKADESFLSSSQIVFPDELIPRDVWNQISGTVNAPAEAEKLAFNMTTFTLPDGMPTNITIRWDDVSVNKRVVVDAIFSNGFE